MLSKILENNRNFITTFIIVLFSVGMLLTADYNIYDINAYVPWLFVVIGSTMLVVPLNMIAYFRNQYFPFFLLLFLFGFFQGNQNLEYYAAFLYLWMMQSQLIINIRYKKGILNAFDLGFFTGFVILFYPPFCVFLLPMWTYYLLLGKLEYKLFLLNLIGLIVFGLFILSILITFDWWFIVDNVKNKLTPNYGSFTRKDLILIPIIVAFFIGFVDYIKNLNRHSVHKKLAYFTVFIYVLSALLYILIWGGDFTEKYLFMSYPFALIYANYFTYTKKRKWAEILTWLIILSVVLYKFSEFIVLPTFLDSLTF